MDDTAKHRLTDLALDIERFRNLDPEDQEWLLPLLSRGIRNTIDLLDEISEEKKTYEEIAKSLNINTSTVTQKLNALLRGGIAIKMGATAAYAPTGRPRKLIRK